MTFSLPPLPYAYDALEPHIDARTMEIHHTKHHATYITNLNTALEGTGWENRSIEDILQNIGQLPADKQTVIRNNGGGHYNHTLFREWMAPQSTELTSALQSQLSASFGSVDTFKEKFAAAALGRFGSGRAWLIKEADGSLTIMSTPNQDNPLMEGKKPILGLDVREHAYYLNYQNKRADYITARWNVVNWKRVEELYETV